MFSKKDKVENFLCQSCGNCCRYFNISLTHLDVERILENRPELKAGDFVTTVPATDKNDSECFISTSGKRELVIKKQANDKECIFLKNNMCSIHEFKPSACRVWPFSLEHEKLVWIKEHKGFIKKYCKHISREGANDPEKLKVWLKNHYKERKLFSKLVNSWNEEMKKELKDGQFFYDILDEDFLNYILKELSIRKKLEEETREEDLLLKKMIGGFIEDRRVEAITSSIVNNLYYSERKPEFSFNLYINENAYNDFVSVESIENIKERLGASFYKISDISFNFKISSLMISNKVIAFYIYPFKQIYSMLDFDTKIIYNPYSIELKVHSYAAQREIELLKLHKNFWFKIMEVINFIKSENYLDSAFLLNYLVIHELSVLVFWENRENFSLPDIPFLDNKAEGLKNFMEKFSMYELNRSGQIKFVSELASIFQKSWELADIKIEDDYRQKIIKELNYLISEYG